MKRRKEEADRRVAPVGGGRNALSGQRGRTLDPGRTAPPNNQGVLKVRQNERAGPAPEGDPERGQKKARAKRKRTTDEETQTISEEREKRLKALAGIRQPLEVRVNTLRASHEDRALRRFVYAEVRAVLDTLAARGMEKTSIKDVRRAVNQRIVQRGVHVTPGKKFKEHVKDAVVDHMAEAPEGSPDWDRRVSDNVHPKDRLWRAEDSRALLAVLKRVETPTTQEGWVAVAREIGRWKRGTDSKDKRMTTTVRTKAALLTDPKTLRKSLYGPALRANSLAAASEKSAQPTEVIFRKAV